MRVDCFDLQLRGDFGSTESSALEKAFQRATSGSSTAGRGLKEVLEKDFKKLAGLLTQRTLAG